MQTTSLVTTKGQVTIPKFYRESLGIEVGTIVEFLLPTEINTNQIILKPLKPFSSFRNAFKGPRYTKRIAREVFTKALLKKGI